MTEEQYEKICDEYYEELKIKQPPEEQKGKIREKLIDMLIFLADFILIWIICLSTLITGYLIGAGLWPI